MQELNSPALKRKLDPAAMGNDAAVLRDLVNTMNDPRLTGAEIPPEERAAVAATTAAVAGAIPPVGQMNVPLPVANQSPVQAPPVAAPTTATRIAPALAHSPASELLFTGHPKSGKHELAGKICARVFSFDDPIRAMAADVFGTLVEPAKLESFIGEVRAWGDGDLAAPFTPARALFINTLRLAGQEAVAQFGVSLSEFGTPGFWARCLLARMARFRKEVPKQTIVVIGVTREDQYQMLRERGFRHYHVACSSSTHAQRGVKTTNTDALSLVVEQNVTQQLSQHPTGGKLWCIWNDPQVPIPSNRLMTPQEFISAYSSCA